MVARRHPMLRRNSVGRLMACGGAAVSAGLVVSHSFAGGTHRPTVGPSAAQSLSVTNRVDMQTSLLGGTPSRRGQETARRGLPEALQGVQAMLDTMPDKVAELGPLGPLYFFAVYVAAECVALPATPLTLSAGYLFGLPMGCAISLAGGTTAACIGFLLARYLLRPQISELAEGNETFKNINRAVEREGFKIILLLRLSPLLPFSLSNYVYGLSNVNFQDYALATLLGFAPGTCGFVYFATQARQLATEGASEPWYVYALGAAVTLSLLKIVSDVARKAVDDAIEADKADEKERQAAAANSFSVPSFENKAKEWLLKESSTSKAKDHSHREESVGARA